MATEFKRACNGNERGGIAAPEKETESLKSDLQFLRLDMSSIEQLLFHDPDREVVTVTATGCHSIKTLRSILAASNTAVTDLAPTHPIRIGTMKPSPSLSDGQQSRSLIAAYVLTMEGYKNLLHMEGGSVSGSRKICLSKIARSEVFKTQIYYNRRRRIEIPLKTTMHPDSFWAFMHFLYNAELWPGVLPDHAADLMRAADRYEIPILKRKCEDFIVRTATPENTVDLLELGCQCESEAIIAAAVEQIRSNPGITESEKFKALAVRQPNAGFRIFPYFLPQPSEKVAQSSVPGSDPNVHYDLPFSIRPTGVHDWWPQMQPCDPSIRFNTVTSQPSIVDIISSLSTLDTNPKVLK